MNEVRISIDDETKSFQPEEYLTSGSKYRIVIPGAASTVGSGDLIVTVREELVGELPRAMRIDLPVVAARSALAASGTDSVGELKTNTDVLQALAQKYPLQTMTFDAVIHSTTNAENVAVGKIRIRLCEVASGEPSGAATLYKGEKGDTISVTAITKTGEDASGNWIYTATFSDYTTKAFTVPKGQRGQDALMTYLREKDTEKTYHECILVNEDGEWVLAVNQDSVIPEKSLDDATIAANAYMKQAGYYANGQPSAEDPTVIVVNGALQFKVAAEAAATTATTAKDAAVSAKDAAVSAKDAAVSAKTAAETAKTAAETAQGAAETAATTAQGIVQDLPTFKTQTLSDITTAKTTALSDITTAKGDDGSQAGHAKSGALGEIADAKTAALQGIDDERDAAIAAIRDETGVAHLAQDETFTGKKTFSGGIVAPGVAGGTVTTFESYGSSETTVQIPVAASGTYVVLLMISNLSASGRTLKVDGVYVTYSSISGSATAMACTGVKTATVPQGGTGHEITLTHKLTTAVTQGTGLSVVAIPLKIG